MMLNVAKLNYITKSRLWEKIFPEKQPPKDTELLSMINDVQDDINMCRQNYEFSTDETLTDMYIYSIMAHELRYSNLLKIAKQRYEEGLI